MDYRNDLEASRLRINTLEAKLDETKASLNAREAELAECRVERDKLRQRAEGKGPPRWSFVLIGLAGLVVGGLLGFIGGVTSSPNPRIVYQTLPPETEPVSTTIGDKTKLEGHIHVPPEPPPVPPATVSGQTKDPEEEVTITSVLEEIRPKVDECYRAEEKDHPKARGNLKVTFDIGPTGKVTRTKLENLPHLDPWWSKRFETCVVGVFQKQTFPNTTGTQVTTSASYFLSSHDLGF